MYLTSWYGLLLSSIGYLALSGLCLAHPLSLSVQLVIMAGSIGILTGGLLSSWFFFSIVLVFLGGMMVVILYICGLSPSSKITVSKKAGVLGVLWCLAGGSGNFAELGESQDFPEVGALFSDLSLSAVGFLGGFVLFVLLVVVKISEGFKGSISEKVS
uniref:NADH dehydrogenase subunit 6 n=1 Tax=Tigriopus kingsejongensis TaxID=1133412 RepID=A0A650DDX5_9MAXI|nr:NADH dehydrogenase subunit 6 [Tigriopus kingsejongensis]